jgi:hypothetical protein
MQRWLTNSLTKFSHILGTKVISAADETKRICY